VTAIHDPHRRRKTTTQALLVLLERPVNLLHHILEILGLEIAQDLHGGALYLLHVADGCGGAVVHGHDAVHHVVEALFVGGNHFLDHLMHLSNTIIYDLDAVVEVCELVLLASDVGGENVFKHLWNVGVIAGGLALLVGLLFVDLLGGEVGLLLVLAIGLFARVGVCGGHDEFMDFEGVGVFGGGGADTKVVAFWEVDLGELAFHPTCLSNDAPCQS
jgi:hypothetical protein